MSFYIHNRFSKNSRDSSTSKSKLVSAFLEFLTNLQPYVKFVFVWFDTILNYCDCNTFLYEQSKLKLSKCKVVGYPVVKRLNEVNYHDRRQT